MCHTTPKALPLLTRRSYIHSTYKLTKAHLLILLLKKKNKSMNEILNILFIGIWA